MSVIAFSKNIGPVSLDVFMSVAHTSTLQTTSNPVESGANVSDHAYLDPKTVTIDVVDEKAAETFNQLLAFQRSRIPFFLVTGLTVYRNMLITSISTTRTKDDSQVLSASVAMTEVIIAKTATVSVDVQDAEPTTPSSQSSPAEPGGAKSTRSASPSVESAGDPVTADRVTDTVQGGDTPMVELPEQAPRRIPARQSLLHRSVYGREYVEIES